MEVRESGAETLIKKCAACNRNVREVSSDECQHSLCNTKPEPLILISTAFEAAAVQCKAYHVLLHYTPWI